MSDQEPAEKDPPGTRICPFCKDVIMYCECERTDPDWSEGNQDDK